MPKTISQPRQVQPAQSSLVSGRFILDAARRSGSAVAALNFYNAETLLAHVRAANALHSSIILQTTEATIDYLGLRMIVAMARAAAEEMERPVALHLDHGRSLELATRCIEAGYTSVMIDGSKLPFAENCQLTRSVAKLAHAHGISVEGELGHVSHNEELTETNFSRHYTRLEDAVRFLDETSVDALAVAVGTAHGFYKGKVRIDFERLEQINAAVGERAALVLHGGSGVPESLLRRAIDVGVTKINFGTELKNAFTLAVKTSLSASDDIDLRRTFAPAIVAVQEVSLEKIRICAS